MAGRIFREYIGPFTKDLPLTHVPNTKPNVQLHLIVAFAKADQYGMFRTSWANKKITSDSIQDYKNNNPDVKVILSIGWYNEDEPFNATNDGDWVTNATGSISQIINSYNFDGIDINYWKVADSSWRFFVPCISGLIHGLRSKCETISIAPRPDLNDLYTRIYRDNKDKIAFVDYQFYVQGLNGPLDTDAKFERAVAEVRMSYPDANLLMGYSTSPRDPVIPNVEVFFRAYENNRSSFRGIFVWCADYSAPRFLFGKRAQEVLSKDQ